MLYVVVKGGKCLWGGGCRAAAALLVAAAQPGAPAPLGVVPSRLLPFSGG